MKPVSIWIGYDTREQAAFDVAKDSIQKRLQPALPPERLPAGLKLVIYGQVKRDSYGRGALCFTNPECEVLEDETAGPSVHSGRVVPIYRKLGALAHAGAAPDPLTARSPACRRI